MKTALSVAVLLAVSGSAMAQTFGTVEFRWRERGLGVVNSANLPAGAANVAAASTLNPTLTTDASFHLILEARVTRAAGNTDLRGLSGVTFNFASSATRTNGAFAATVVGASTDLRNAATTSVAASGLTLPAGATTLAGGANGQRGIFAPFRAVADIGSANQPAIGVQNFSTATTGNPAYANRATMENVVVAVNQDPFNEQIDNGDGTFSPGLYNSQFQYAGLDAWVPIYYTVYNLTNVAGNTSNIVITPEIVGSGAGDSGIRGFRGINNAQGIDSYQLGLGQTGVPTFTIVIPAPGSAALLGLGGLLAARRRRA